LKFEKCVKILGKEGGMKDREGMNKKCEEGSKEVEKENKNKIKRLKK